MARGLSPHGNAAERPGAPARWRTRRCRCRTHPRPGPPAPRRGTPSRSPHRGSWPGRCHGRCDRRLRRRTSTSGHCARRRCRSGWRIRGSILWFGRLCWRGRDPGRGEMALCLGHLLSGEAHCMCGIRAPLLDSMPTHAGPAGLSSRGRGRSLRRGARPRTESACRASTTPAGNAGTSAPGPARWEAGSWS